MNTDIRLSVGFWQHPKTKKTVKRLGLEGIRSLQVLWLWAAVNKPDGVLSGMDWEDIELAADWQGEEKSFFDEAMGRWIDETEGDYVLHDWAEHNPYVVEAEDRSDKARFSRLATVNRAEYERLKSTGVNAISKEDYDSLTTVKRQPDDRRTNVNAPPTPAPAPSPKPEELRVTPSELCPQPPLASASPTVLETPEGIEPDDELPPLQADHPPDCPHEKIIALYHEALPELPRARTWPEHRRKLLRSRHRETWERLRRAEKPHGDDDLIAWWKAYFARVRASPFLMGKVCDRSGKGFCADLEWLVKPSNYAKVLDGKYLERRPNA